MLKFVNGVQYFPFNEHEEVIMLNKAQPNSIFIFDDIAFEKQDNVNAFFSMGMSIFWSYLSRMN